MSGASRLSPGTLATYLSDGSGTPGDIRGLAIVLWTRTAGVRMADGPPGSINTVTMLVQAGRVEWTFNRRTWVRPATEGWDP